MEYLEKNRILTDTQFGFRKGRSCTSNVLLFIDKLLDEIDKGKCVDVIYLDMAKAFDKVSHKKLIVRLKQIGLEGKLLKWIEGWLKDRRQRVVLGESALSGKG